MGYSNLGMAGLNPMGPSPLQGAPNGFGYPQPAMTPPANFPAGPPAGGFPPNMPALPPELSALSGKLSPEQTQQLAKMMMQNMAAGGGPQAGLEEFNNKLQEAVMPGGPSAFLYGGLAGCGTAYLLNQLFMDRAGGSLLARGAARLDNMPGVRHASGLLEKQVFDRLRGGNAWAQQLALHMHPDAVQKLHLEKLINARSAALGPELTQKLFYQAGSVATLETRAIRLAKVAKDAKTRRVLDEVLRGTRSLNNQFFGIYRDQHRLMQTLGKDVGPIGRMYANSMLYLKRIMGGHTLHLSSAPAAQSTSLLGKAGNLLSKCIGPFLAGGIIFGLSYGHAKKAEEEDKFKTFMHSLFGIGLGNFIGWEVGKKLIRFTLNTVIPKFGNKHLLFGLSRFVPFLGRVTWAGTIAEIGAMLILSQPFQKVGEKLAHLIFGKPQSVIEEENKKQGIYPAKALPSTNEPGQSGLRRNLAGFDSFNKQRANAKQNDMTPSSTSKTTGPETDPGTYYPDEKFSLTPEEIAENAIGAREQSNANDMLSSLGQHSGFHNLFAPQLPVEGGGGH
jgi:hypothetical protein